MNEPQLGRTVRHPATGRKLQSSIAQALADLDLLARSHFWERGKWKQGALLWKVLLEQSQIRVTADTGLAPTIRKNDLAYELKKIHGSPVKVDAKLWSRFQRFHRTHVRGRLEVACSKSGLDVLFAERVTNDGQGGNPDASEALYWLTLKPGVQPNEQPEASTLTLPEHSVLEQAAAAMPASGPPADGVDIAESADNWPHSGAQQDAGVVPPQPTAAPATSRDRPSEQVAGIESVLAWSLANSHDHRLHRCTPCHPQYSLTQTIAVLGLTVLSASLLLAHAVDLLSPLQALANAIQSITDALNGTVTIRT